MIPPKLEYTCLTDYFNPSNRANLQEIVNSATLVVQNWIAPSQTNFSFIANHFEAPPSRTRTNGPSIAQQVTQIVEYVKLNLTDIWTKSAVIQENLDCSSNFAEDPLYTRFLMTGRQLNNSDVIGFIGHLEYLHNPTSIKILNNKLVGDFNIIDDLDPCYVITGHKASKLAQGWQLVTDNQVTLDDESPSILPVPNKFQEQIIVYPFIYPAKNALSFAHIVLIIIDQKQQKIFHFDPQGLTSDDPNRLYLFEDDPSFNMHENLVELARVLFNGTEENVIENKRRHQKDPVSCGVFACWVLERLAQGKSVEEAISYSEIEESIISARKRMGLLYIQTMQLRYPPQTKIDFTPSDTNYFDFDPE